MQLALDRPCVSGCWLWLGDKAGGCEFVLESEGEIVVVVRLSGVCSGR